MRPNYESSFERGQTLVRYCLAGAIGTGVCALFFTAPGTPLNVALTFLSMAMLVGMVVCASRFCRCPHCGRSIIGGALKVTVCPHCGRDLHSGKKVKKSRR